MSGRASLIADYKMRCTERKIRPEEIAVYRGLITERVLLIKPNRTDNSSLSKLLGHSKIFEICQFRRPEPNRGIDLPIENPHFCILKTEFVVLVSSPALA